MEGFDVGLEVSKEIVEDGECDRLFRLSPSLAVVSFDTSDDALDQWRFACGKIEAGFDV